MHLLVVEDDDIVRMLMVEVLEELGYEVIQAEDAAAALRVLEDPSQALALMMTDVGLPDMRGEALAGKAREFCRCCGQTLLGQRFCLLKCRQGSLRGQIVKIRLSCVDKHLLQYRIMCRIGST